MTKDERIAHTVRCHIIHRKEELAAAEQARKPKAELLARNFALAARLAPLDGLPVINRDDGEAWRVKVGVARDGAGSVVRVEEVYERIAGECLFEISASPTYCHVKGIEYVFGEDQLVEHVFTKVLERVYA